MIHIKSFFVVIVTAGILFSLAMRATADEGSNDINMLGAFTVNDEIYVGRVGSPDAKRITSGWPDYKPSWSPDGKWIVFFRIVKNHTLAIPKWKTKICVVSPDGGTLRELTSGEFADYNPTWMRDGTNRIIINRYDPGQNRGYLYLTTPDAKVGDETCVSNPDFSEFGHCGMKDGRIVISTSQGLAFSYLFSSSENGMYSPPFMRLLTPDPGKIGRYENLRYDTKITMLPNRVTLSPDEKKMTFEMDNSFGQFGYAGHPLVVADFDGALAAVTRLTTFCFTAADEFALYPAWTADAKGIIYFAGSVGSKYQFYLYDVARGKSIRVSPDRMSEYKYFCGASTPK
ncbi:MAG TPA: hypothetical protein VF857_08115 [Spirochaetota bacterium]